MTQKIEEALRQLKAEVYGALGIARPEIVAAIGETNVRCIELRLSQAEEALASHAPSDKNAEGLIWAVGRWNAEVSNRPLVNVHRRTLDDTWRQVIRYFGGDPDILIGPNHDTLLAKPSEAKRAEIEHNDH